MKKHKLVLLYIFICSICISCSNGQSVSVNTENINEVNTSESEEECYKNLEDLDPLSEGYVDISRKSETDVYRTYFSKSEKKIVVEHSLDNGDTWMRTLIPYIEYQYGIYEVHLSFVDEQTGYLLYCGEPACGLMNEVLFCTEDGGKSFIEVADISNQISDYPKDIEFLSKDIGFMIMKYHGNGPVYYQTNDGGRSWTKQSIELPETEFAYAQGNKITRNANGEIEVQIELVSHIKQNQYVTYYTDDGIVWKMK